MTAAANSWRICHI